MINNRIREKSLHRTVPILFLAAVFANSCSVDSGGSSHTGNTANSNQIKASIANSPAAPANSNTNAPTVNQISNRNVSNKDAVSKFSARKEESASGGVKQPAPDNSEPSTFLGENLVQTRTFKTHPRIQKIEVTTFVAENNRKVIKIYLKNGRVKEVPREKITEAMIEPAEDILKAIQ